MTDKRELRAEMRRRRKRLAELSPDAAGRAATHMPELLDILFAITAGFAAEARDRRHVAALYRAQGSEFDPTAVGRALQTAGIGLCLPVVIEREAPLIFRAWSPGEPLELDAAGVPAPLPLADQATPDLVFVPLLAFDRFGGRLGQGGGYYDRTLEALRGRSPRPWFIGLAYAGQEVERLATEAHDQPLDGILTEVGYQQASRISR